MAPLATLLLCALCLDLAAPVGAETPIRKVITLLEEMKVQVEKEASDDLVAYDKYMCWCETNKKEKTEAVAIAEQHIADLTTFLAEAEAKEGELKTEIGTLKADIAADDDALKTATSVRAKELEAFTATEADMKETRGLLSEALKVLSKLQLVQKSGRAGVEDTERVATALVQVRNIVQRFPKYHNVLQKDLYDVLGSLQAVEQKAVRQQERGAVAGAFLAETFLPKREVAALEQEGRRLLPWEKTEEQVGMEANPDATLQGAAAGAKSYNARSGSIVGILAEMQDEFTRDLSEAQKADFEAEVGFQDLRAAKFQEITAATNQKEAKEQELAELLAKVAEAKEDKAATEEALAADQAFLLTLEKNCKDEDAQYKERLAVRTEEIRALGEALKILTEDSARDLYAKTMTFVQLSADQRLAAAQESAIRRSVQTIAAMARKHGNWALASLAVRAQLDAFTKVKVMMDKMLEELKKQQSEEYAKWESCKNDIDGTEDSIKEGEQMKKDLDEKHLQLANTIEKLEKEIEELKTDVSEMEVSLKKAGEERKAANQVYQTSVSDQRATIQIIEKALARLKAFYGFTQVEVHAHSQQVPGAPAPPPPPKGKAYEKSGGAASALDLLKMVIEDAERSVQDLSTTEQKAQEDYAAYVTDATASIEADRASIEQKIGEVASTKAEKAKTEEAQTSNDQELATQTELLKAEHLECDYILKYFDIRQKARAEEMDSIVDAKAILSGADFGKK